MGSHQDLHLLRVTSGLSSKAPPNLLYTRTLTPPLRQHIRPAQAENPHTSRVLRILPYRKEMQ